MLKSRLAQNLKINTIDSMNLNIKFILSEYEIWVISFLKLD